MAGNRDTNEAVSQATEEPRHVVRTVFLILLGAAVLCGAGVTAGLVDAAAAKSRVPEVAGMTAASASKALSAARLRDGRARYYVTRDFPAGRIVSEYPAPGTLVAPGTAVDVRIADAPRKVTVPDVRFADVATAEKTLGYSLFRPTLLYAYSKDVETGLVIEQLPRAGDAAATGSSSVIVVSLGPGKGGASVPSLVGKLLGPARSQLTSQTLFADVRTVVADGVADGTVVDQAPAAGSAVPAASTVAVSIATYQPTPW